MLWAEIKALLQSNFSHTSNPWLPYNFYSNYHSKTVTKDLTLTQLNSSSVDTCSRHNTSFSVSPGSQQWERSDPNQPIQHFVSTFILSRLTNAKICINLQQKIEIGISEVSTHTWKIKKIQINSIDIYVAYTSYLLTSCFHSKH